MESKIIAVDFDDTLFECDYPNIGKPIKANINYIKKLQRQGHRIILNTCRAGKALQDAVKKCLEQGIVFTAINDQDPIAKVLWQDETSTKVFADVYFDDHNVSNLEELKRRMEKNEE